MTGRTDWLPIRRACLVFAGDHGVARHGVSAYPQEVTLQMVLNFLAGGAAVNVLARQMGARLVVVDAGVAGDLDPAPGLFIGKVARGTADFTAGPAMSAEEADAAFAVGARALEAELAHGLDILAVGEMGIGNTTSASAIVAAITGRPVAEVTGRGTGLDDSGRQRKIGLIEESLALHAPGNVETLRKLGGFEIGAMAGAMTAAAAARIPVVIDGFISTAAALLAVQQNPGVGDYLVASHRSVEPGHRAALEWLGLEPLLDLDLRLGEGTGALLALPVIEASMRTLQEMATFESAGVSDRDG
jgi:nicotinate-nucleotide--dimethylbenzimidazole phosphoribosyltransferase